MPFSPDSERFGKKDWMMLAGEMGAGFTKVVDTPDLNRTDKASPLKGKELFRFDKGPVTALVWDNSTTDSCVVELYVNGQQVGEHEGAFQAEIKARMEGVQTEGRRTTQ